MSRASPGALAVALLAGCAGAGTQGIARAPLTAAAAPAECRAIGPLMDLRADLVGAPEVDSELAALVNVEHQLAAVAVARARIRSTRALADLDARLARLSTALADDEQRLSRHIEALRRSYAAAQDALDEASVCKGVDARAPAAPPFATREQRRRVAFAPRTAEVEAQLKRNQTTLQSKACASTARLAAAIRSLDLTSRESVSMVSGHLKELTFDGAAAKVRDRLVGALVEHAKNLGALEQARRANPGPETELVSSLARLRTELDDLGKRCIDESNGAADLAEGGSGTPRQVTVLVRPTWPDPEGGKPKSTGSFGSGVLVRWRAPSGKTEVRVLTNSHVLGGARSAELLEADRVQLAAEGGDTKDAPKPWRASVLRVSDDDDLAIMRVEADDGPPLPNAGLSFRFTPPKEQEPVTAAGFPGIGGHPSFQVSTGVVSNASLRASQGPFGVYVQHTAAIDPGNSGGPLLDGEGKLLGINTIKIFGRESVGLAIPSSRVKLALLRADDRPTFAAKHAESLCNAFVATLASDAPRQAVVDRLSLGLTEPRRHTANAEVSAYLARVRGAQEGPQAVARAEAYARLRAKLEAEGGVPILATCTEVAAGSRPDTFTAKFSTRTASHALTLAPEDGQLRIASIE
jgi:S1-C subfamily serine protease